MKGTECKIGALWGLLIALGLAASGWMDEQLRFPAILIPLVISGLAAYQIGTFTMLLAGLWCALFCMVGGALRPGWFLYAEAYLWALVGMGTLTARWADRVRAFRIKRFMWTAAGMLFLAGLAFWLR